MFAIVEIAGLQYKVEQDQKLFVHRLKGDKGSKVSFDKVLLTVNGTTTIGAPAVSGITVDAEILDHVKADKVIIFKKKRRKGYEKKNGHRQSLTQIVITGITGFDGAKKTAKKETAEPKAAKAAKTETKAVANRDAATVNFGEDHELNHLLEKNGLSQSSDNRKVLVELGKELKESLGKRVLGSEEFDAFIKENLEKLTPKK
ncbi:50S ribosomal protein L21 [Kaistella montana]|uniref:Large ribosomal subunit protein bL21 n=1 Tax=Kaistella montana TaxID=1849733 RepID=A0ABW5KBV3_9FLAO|nr:50S ribosomal protein L21 [Kaistella montana]MCQ4035939.1 50S ribosomal protein L21 [Kaistella montana]